MITNRKDIIGATFWWVAERSEQNINRQIDDVLPWVFMTLDSIYLTIDKFPEKWASEQSMNSSVGGLNSATISLPLNPNEYMLLRSSLALISDLYLLLNALIKKGKLMELTEPIERLYREADKYRDIRNYFSHLDERLVDLKKHGISEALDLDCGLKYSSETEDCYHLILQGNKLYFNQYKKTYEIDLGKQSFNNIFKFSRDIYEIITKHVIHAEESKGYKNINEIYPAF